MILPWQHQSIYSSECQRMFEVLIILPQIDTWDEKKFITMILNNQGHMDSMH
jgi:hypothetical protein